MHLHMKTQYDSQPRATMGIIGRFVLFVMMGFCRTFFLKFGRIIQLDWEEFEANFEFSSFRKTLMTKRTKLPQFTISPISDNINNWHVSYQT